MEKLRRGAGLETRCVYGFQVSRFLAVKKQPDLKAIVDTATDACIAADRAVDDLERPVQEATADRIVADGALDDSARLVSRGLAARTPRAERERPYLDVFPKGLGEYVEATLSDQVYRYTRLIERLEAFLPADDPVRLELVPALGAQLDAWKLSDQGVDAARAEQDAARDARTDTIDAWDTAIDQAYGLLVARVGKKEAEKCFPRTRRPAPPPAPPAPDPANADPDDPTPELPVS